MRAANAVYDDDDDYDRLGFVNADAYRNYTDSVNKLNFLADNMQPADPGSLWQYAVYGIDISNIPFAATHALQNAVQHLANNFSTGSRESFDQTKPCTICGEVGHNFFGCPQLQDNDKVKQAYICLRFAVNRFLKSVTKFNDPNNLSSLATMTLSSIKELAGLAYPQTLGSLRLLPAPRALPHSTPPDTNDLFISTLQSMQTEISNLSSVVGHLLAVRSSSSPADTDDNTNSTGNTNDSLLAYLSADRRLDFYLRWG